jgi:hypothetical protein
MVRGGYRGYSYFRTVTAAENPGMKFGSLPDHCRCTAKAKSTGERCKDMKVKGQTVCRRHGAKSLKATRAKMLRLAARLRGERPKNYTCD